jgi:glycosyltransferase involved in cell wall biosynthesis
MLAKGEVYLNHSSQVRNLIMLCYWFPPSGGMSSLVSLHLANAAAEKGWKVTVISPAFPESHPQAVPDLTLSSRLDRSINVIKTFPGWLAWIMSRLVPRHALTGAMSGGLGQENRWMAVALPLLRKVYGVLTRTIMIPDVRVDWAPHALLALRRVMLHHSYGRDTVLFTYGFPYSAYLVGWVARRLWGCHWIAYEGDMWTHHPEARTLPRWRRWLDRKLESVLFSATELLIVNNEYMKDALRQTYGADFARKVRIIELGYDPDEYESARKEISTDGRFTIVYTGTLSFLHNLAPLCSALRKISGSVKWRLGVLGRIAPPICVLLQDLAGFGQVELEGTVSRAEVVAAQCGATLLLSYGMSGGMQIPAKLIEYQAAGRPILILSDDPTNDLSISWIHKAGFGVAIENSESVVSDWLQQACRAWQKDLFEAEFPPQHSAPPTWADAGRVFSNLLEHVAKRDRA